MGMLGTWSILTVRFDGVRPSPFQRLPAAVIDPYPSTALSTMPARPDSRCGVPTGEAPVWGYTERMWSFEDGLNR